MNEQARDEKLVEKVRVFLDESMESLSPEVRLRLQEARYRAVQAAGEKPRFFSFARWVTVGGLATATTAVLALFFWFNVPSVEIPDKQVEDIEILTSKDQIDFYKDLEFFRWLAAKENG